MSFWIYQEYLNNSYLQTYVGGFFQGGFFTTIILVAIGLFTIIALGLFAKLRSTRKELEGIISTDTFQSNGRGRGQPVDTRTEQHLIEMIRKTMPVMNSGPGTDGRMPTLRRKDSQSGTEESGTNQQTGKHLWKLSY